MKRLIIQFVFIMAFIAGCAAHTNHKSKSPEMKILTPPVCIGDDSIELPSPDSEFLYAYYPELIYEEAPQYPPDCKIDRIVAVWVWVYVDSTGNVPRACATNCSDPGLGFEEAATSAALKSKYKPVVVDGKPLGRWIDYKVTFQPDI